jgi:hypothetical protein
MAFPHTLQATPEAPKKTQKSKLKVCFLLPEPSKSLLKANSFGAHSRSDFLKKQN